MKYLKVGDVFRFEHLNEPEFNRILSVTQIGVEHVHWNDGTVTTRVDTLADVPRLVVGGRPPRKGDVYAFSGDPLKPCDLTVEHVEHIDQEFHARFNNSWVKTWTEIYSVPRVVISDAAYRDLFYFADRVGELPYDHLATPPPVAPTPTPTPTLEGLKTMLTNTTTQQPVPPTKAETAPNQIFIEGSDWGTTNRYRVVLIPPKNTGWLPGLVIEVQSNRRDAMGVPQWDPAPEGTEAKRYQPYEVVLAALAQKIVELEAAVAELKTINEIKGVKSLASHYGATLGG